MVGDMFNFNNEYQNFNLSMIGEMRVNMTAVSKKVVCTQNKSNFLEVFKDEDPELVPIEKYGPIFCETLNGKLKTVPETLEEFESLKQFVVNYLLVKKAWGMTLLVSGYVFSPAVTKPMVGYPPNGYYTEIREISTGRLLNISKKVRETGLYFKAREAFQKREKLCVMLGLHRNPVNETLYLGCSSIYPSTCAICVFERKIHVKLSGLCAQSPVDKSYALLDPESEVYEGDHWSDFYRYGTFSGDLTF